MNRLKDETKDENKNVLQIQTICKEYGTSYILLFINFYLQWMKWNE